MASGLILLLLFMQAVTAAYACPQMDSLSSQPPAEVMPGCQGHDGGMDHKQPLLCKASCEQTLKSTTPALAFDAIPAPVVLYVLALAHQAQAELQSPRIVAAQLGEPPPGWPPSYLFHRNLRN